MQVSLKHETLTLRQHSLPSIRKNIHILSIFPDNHHLQLYTSTKTGPLYVIIATNTDTQKQDVDQKQFAEIAEKMTTQVTKQTKSPNESKCVNCGK